MRRLKCGEEKPGCLRCAKSGWQCDGYDWSSSNLASLPCPPSPKSSLYTPSVALDLDEREWKYFQVYAEQKPTSLDHRDTNCFSWKQIVLQECHSNPCVRHTMVAQGALAMSQVARTPWAYFFGVNAAQNPHHEFALTQYEKALRALRSSISGFQKGKGVRATLISSLALSLFDCCCGNGAFAAQHVRFGKKLLSTWQSANNDSKNQSPEHLVAAQDPIDLSLIRMFFRLDISILCFMG